MRVKVLCEAAREASVHVILIKVVRPVVPKNRLVTADGDFTGNAQNR